MNIFATSSCPVQSAKSLDDQRLVKMILESCQILATVSSSLGEWNERFPRPTHKNHPCVKWTAKSSDNFHWLLEHASAMDAERKKRWGHNIEHKTLSACLNGNIELVARNLPSGLTPHVNCARNSALGVDYTHLPDTHLAYQLYLHDRWLLQARPAKSTIKGLFSTKA